MLGRMHPTMPTYCSKPSSVTRLRASLSLIFRMQRKKKNQDLSSSCYWGKNL